MDFFGLFDPRPSNKVSKMGVTNLKIKVGAIFKRRRPPMNNLCTELNGRHYSQSVGRLFNTVIFN